MMENHHDDGEDGVSFLDGLISQETRRRTREQTRPFIDACCTPTCIRTSVLSSCIVALLLTVLIISINLTSHPENETQELHPNDPPYWMLNQVTSTQIKQHIRYLSSDLLEGRAPGSRGEELAISYISSHFQAAGLTPLPSQISQEYSNLEDPFIHVVPMIGLTVESSTSMTFNVNNDQYSLFNVSSDFTADSELGQPNVTLQNVQMVFGGNCVKTADKYGIDDFKGIEIKNKMIICLMNPLPTDDKFDNLINSQIAADYYGSLPQKLIYLRSRGVSGVLWVHSENSTGYKWDVFQTRFGTGEQTSLGRSSILFKGWIKEEVAAQIASLNGKSWSDMLERATHAGHFRPEELKTTFSIQTNFVVRYFNAFNVIGYLGPEPAQNFNGTDFDYNNEYPKYNYINQDIFSNSIFMTAHHDGLGIREDNKTYDKIYNGAVDNASGLAALISSAYALSALYKEPFVVFPDYDPPPLLKPIIFISTASEVENMGASYFLGSCSEGDCKTSALINYDIMNMWGATSNAVILGKNMSSLISNIVENSTKAEGMHTQEMPPSPIDKYSWSFILKSIPSISFGTGSVKDPNPVTNYIKEKQYRPNDEFTEDLDMKGIMQQIRLALRITYSLSISSKNPKIDDYDYINALW